MGTREEIALKSLLPHDERAVRETAGVLPRLVPAKAANRLLHGRRHVDHPPADGAGARLAFLGRALESRFHGGSLLIKVTISH